MFAIRRRWGLAALAAVAACAQLQAEPDAGHGDTGVVSISPVTPHTRDDLHALVSSPSSELYAFRWSQDGVAREDLGGLTVPASATRKGERWQVDLAANGAVVSTASVTILDSPPDPPVVSVPAVAPAGAPIQCHLDAPAVDPDDDVVSYSATWRRNGQDFTGASKTSFLADTVPGDATGHPGDTFVCMVTATDGEASTLAMSNPAVISCDNVPTPGPITLAFSGATQTYTVPPCVKHVSLEAWGAQGAGGFGGAGGYAKGTLDVEGGQVLVVQVGGKNGYNGGGVGTAGSNPANGGGGSDVRVDGDTVDHRVLVGGGGGGGMTTDVGSYVGGSGGGGACGTGFCGGAGGLGFSSNGSAGGVAGGNGGSGTHGGGGGGGGGAGGGSGACESGYLPMTCGGQGAIGVGGAGDGGQENVHPTCFSMKGGTAGGGGGYYGGGGSSLGYCGSGGGGGGSSFVGALGAPVMTPGVRSGDGQVTITPY